MRLHPLRPNRNKKMPDTEIVGVIQTAHAPGFIGAVIQIILWSLFVQFNRMLWSVQGIVHLDQSLAQWEAHFRGKCYFQVTYRVEVQSGAAGGIAARVKRLESGV